MFTKKEQKAIDYFGGIKEFLSLCISYKEYYDNRQYLEHTETNFDCTNIHGLCVINKMYICEDRNYLDLIVDGNRYCVELSDECNEYLTRIKITLSEIYAELSEDSLESFSFLKAKPFNVNVVNGIVTSICLVDPKKFFENLSILDKVMTA